MSQGRTTASKIFVTGLKVQAQIGVYRHEIGRVQPLIVDVELDVPTTASDRLAETVNYETVDNVTETLIEMTAGRGPDACIDAVGLEAHAHGPVGAYDRVKQQLHLETDRPNALRQAMIACRNGGTLSITYARWRQWSNATSEPITLMTASGRFRSSGGTSGRCSTSRTTS